MPHQCAHWFAMTAFRKEEPKMMYTQTPEKLAQQQKLDRELAAVLMAISVTTRSIARNIHLLSMQRHVKGVNPYDKR